MLSKAINHYDIIVLIIVYTILKFTPNLANFFQQIADVIRKLGQHFFSIFLETSYDFLVMVKIQAL